MAYSYYPATYNPNYNPYQQAYQQQAALQQQMQQQQTQQQQIQNGGFVSAPTEDFARNYPVAPGNSVSFRDEKLPYLYTKTVGFSALDQPVFEKFRLVREEDAPAVAEPQKEQTAVDLSLYVEKREFDALAARVDALEADKPIKKIKKKEDADDE